MNSTVKLSPSFKVQRWTSFYREIEILKDTLSVDIHTRTITDVEECYGHCQTKEINCPGEEKITGVH